MLQRLINKCANAVARLGPEVAPTCHKNGGDRKEEAPKLLKGHSVEIFDSREYLDQLVHI